MKITRGGFFKTLAAAVTAAPLGKAATESLLKRLESNPARPLRPYFTTLTPTLTSEQSRDLQKIVLRSFNVSPY